MRTKRLAVVGLTVFLGGYLLLLANGVRIALLERTHGWEITPLPDHPMAHIAVYAGSATALLFVSAAVDAANR